MDENDIIVDPISPSELDLVGNSIIDVDTSYPFENVVHVKQYDTVRVVECHLYTSGVKWYVPSSNIYCMVSYKKSDHIGGFYDVTENNVIAVTVDGQDRSIIYLTLDAQIMRTPSTLEYPTFVEAVFYETIRGDRLSSFSFKVEVEEASVREVDLASNPYFNVLAQQIRAVLDIDAAMTNISATVTYLNPAADPVVAVVRDGDDYVFHFGLPKTALIETSATKLAPNATPTATITGGQTVGSNYHIDFGIPSMPAITAQAHGIPEGQQPYVVVTGGQTAGQAYDIDFNIPYASTPEVQTITYAYALSTNGQLPPSSADAWKSSISELGGQDALKGKFLWSRSIIKWSNSENRSINYTVAYNGQDATGTVVSVNGRDGAVTVDLNDFFDFVSVI